MKNMILGLAGLCTFGLLFTTPALGQAATDVNCDGCVQSGDIATNGVRRADIQNFSINTPKLNNFAVTTEKIKTGSVTESKLADGAVTANKLAADAIGMTQIDPTQVQIRVGGLCDWGSFITAIGQDGSTTCGNGTENPNDSNSNTRYGTDSLAANTTGFSNTAIGQNVLGQNTTGFLNTASGHRALFSNTTGFSNTATGADVLLNNTDGRSNTATGQGALAANTIGNYNTAIGTEASSANTTGNENTANGYQALRDSSTGHSNTASGYHALARNSTGNYNTASGVDALGTSVYLNPVVAITGSYNTANGFQALAGLTTGSYNTASGVDALVRNKTGAYNVAVGYQAGQDYTTGDRNIAIDNPGFAAESFTTRIGSLQTRAFVAGIRGVTTDVADAVTVMIDSSGQLGTVSSSARYKEDIQDMGSSSDRLLQLRPVTFRYKEAYENGEKPLDYGLIAEEVAEVFPELVIYNKQNQPETVKYRLLSTLLLNELQKEHRVNQEQGLEMAELKAQVAELNQLVQQMAKLALPATELVANNTGD